MDNRRLRLDDEDLLLEIPLYLRGTIPPQDKRECLEDAGPNKGSLSKRIDGDGKLSQKKDGERE